METTTPAEKYVTKITYPTGEVEYRPGVASAVMAEMRGRVPEGTKFAPRMASEVPASEYAGGTATEGPITVGEIVYVFHIGVRKAGRVTKVGRTRVTVEVAVGRGATARTKEITRAMAEVTR